MVTPRFGRLDPQRPQWCFLSFKQSSRLWLWDSSINLQHVLALPCFYEKQNTEHCYIQPCQIQKLCFSLWDMRPKRRQTLYQSDRSLKDESEQRSCFMMMLLHDDVALIISGITFLVVNNMSKSVFSKHMHWRWIETVHVLFMSSSLAHVTWNQTATLIGESGAWTHWSFSFQKMFNYWCCSFKASFT